MWQRAVVLVPLVATLARFPSRQQGGTAAAAAHPFGADEVTIGSAPFRPELILSATAQEVPIVAVVRDANGNALDGFTRSDFDVFDQGKPAKITQFSAQRRAGESTSSAVARTAAPAAGIDAPTPQPRSIALFFDNVFTSWQSFAFARNAALKFLNSGLPAQEQVGIFTSSGAVETGFTDQAATLLPTLERLRAWGPQGPVTGGKFGFNCAVSQPVTQGLRRAIARLSRQPGDRVLILISNGWGASRYSSCLDPVTEAALNAHVVINAVDTLGLTANVHIASPTGHLDPFEGMAQLAAATDMAELARQTGGELIENQNIFPATVRRLFSPPAVAYELTIAPTPIRNGAFHALSVRLKPGLHGRVSARRGYYAPYDASNSPVALQRTLNQAAMDTREARQFSATLLDPPGRYDDGPGVHAVFEIEPKVLDWIKDMDGSRVQQLVFAGVLYKPNGAYVTGKEAVMTFHLSPASFQYLQRIGIHGEMTLPAPAGTYRLRGVIEESVKGKIATFTREVTIQ